MSARGAAAFLVLACCAGVALVPPARAATLLLKRDWLKAHKNRVTASDDCHIDQSHTSPNSIGSDGDDGDLHMACRCPGIGLPLVAEIVDAKAFPSAVALAKTMMGQPSASNVQTVTGVWRCWLEHPSTKPQTQGSTVPKPTSTNPDHSIEIHPITRLGNETLLASFTKLPGFKPYAVSTAFKDYEARVFRVSSTASFVSIQGTRARYNYAKFVFTVAAPPTKVADGWFVFAHVDGVADSVRRMVVAAGTPPATLIATANTGARFAAVGVPRINLERIDRVVTKFPTGTTDVRGAYEMIVVAMEKAK